MDYGRAFKEIREELGWNRPQVAEKLGITRGALWKIENSKTEPKRKTIHKFCAEAHIPIAYFYTKTMDLEDYICP